MAESGLTTQSPYLTYLLEIIMRRLSVVGANSCRFYNRPVSVRNYPEPPEPQVDEDFADDVLSPEDEYYRDERADALREARLDGEF